jgi:hypothetical protein
MPIAKAVIARWVTATLAAAALCATSAAPASAGWFIEGEALSGSAALATTAAVEEPFLLEGAGLNAECAGSVVESTKPEIKSSNRMATNLLFTACKTGNEGCTTPTTLGTVPLLAELTEQAVSDEEAKFRPETGTLISTIKLSGEKCAVAGNKPVTGAFRGKLPDLEREALPIALYAEPGELLISSSEAKLQDLYVVKVGNRALFFFANNELAVRPKGGIPSFDKVTKKWALKFGVNEKIEMEAANLTAAEYKVVQLKLEPNEVNYKFFAPVGVPKCEVGKGIAADPGHCFFGVELLKVGGATFKMEYNVNKKFSLPLTP